MRPTLHRAPARFRTRGPGRGAARCARTLWRVLLGAALSAAPAARADPLAPLAWLAGCWAAVGGEAGSGELWSPPAGGSMMGMGRTVREGRLVDFEFMQIRALPDGRLVFLAQPGGRAPTQFVAVRSQADETVFENPSHDFPQRVIYRRADQGRLQTRIEGLRNGTLRGVDMPLRRVACADGALPAGSAPGVQPTVPVPVPVR
jgi:hypothetical protein